MHLAGAGTDRAVLKQTQETIFIHNILCDVLGLGGDAVQGEAKHTPVKTMKTYASQDSMQFHYILQIIIIFHRIQHRE